jgi:hypothetical protein
MTCTLEMLLGDDSTERETENYPLTVSIKIEEGMFVGGDQLTDLKVTIAVFDPPGPPPVDYTADILEFFFNADPNVGPLTFYAANGTTLLLPPLTPQGQPDLTLEGVATFEHAVALGVAGGGDGINNGATFFISNLTGETIDNQYIGVRAQSISSTPTQTGSDSQKLRGFLPDCPEGKIEGIKYRDTDGNAATTNDRTGLGSVTIQLYADADNDNQVDSDETLLATTTTGTDGTYKFENLAFGNYVVKELVPTGSYAITPVEVGADPSAGTPTVSNVNFANTVFAKIVGEKYEDANGPLAGGALTTVPDWTIKLFENGTDLDGDGQTNSLIATQTTGTGGAYEFKDLKLGAYRIEEVVETGWNNVSPTFYNVVLNQSGMTYGDGDGETTDFVNYRYGRITGEKYEDANGTLPDGAQTAVPSWTITLYKDAGSGTLGDKVAETTTNSSGVYEFTNVDIGNYVVVEEVQTGWKSISPTQRLVTIDESGETFGDGTGEVTDFVNYRTGKIEGRKLIDQDGSLDTTGDRVGSDGWTVRLYADANNDGTPDGAAIATTTTATVNGVVGAYSFTGIDPGYYIVEEVLRDGYVNLTSLQLDADMTVSGGSTTVNFVNEVAVCYEGRTPGFWRQSQNYDVKADIDGAFVIGGVSYTTYASLIGLSYETVFGLNGNGDGPLDVTWNPRGSGFDIDTGTILQALTVEGGGEQGAFLRHSSAALFNSLADTVDYAMTTQQVLDRVRGAFDGGNTAWIPGTTDAAERAYLAGIFEGLNELGESTEPGFECAVVNPDFTIRESYLFA